ncbi:MAG: hypothetical protein ABJE00_07945 [Erythrobacter sp.]
MRASFLKAGLPLAVGSSTLISCGGAPELDMSEAGYAGANECYVAMMAYNPLGEETGSETYENGPTNARNAIKEIAAAVGIDDAKVESDAKANDDEIRSLIAKGKADFIDPDFKAAREKAVECGEIYE